MTLTERDQKHLWHPYTQHHSADPPLPIARAEGALLYDEYGNTYIDAVSSWWVNTYGHAHPYIAKRIHEQALKLEHVIFAGFTHPPAVELAEGLVRLLPEEINRVFYSDNGSTAVEIAIKMAIQYYHNQERPRRRLIAFEHAFHGETFGAMSASGDLSFNNPFKDHLFEVWRIPEPVRGREEEAIRVLRAHLETKDCYAFLFEPLVMGAGGMIMYEPEVLDELIRLCKDFGVLCIADEVMTGFGRTGKNFASDYLKQTPDIVALSKGLTGGSMPLAVTACTEAIYKAFLSENKLKTFFHGHSYTANPLGCAAALAGLELLEAGTTREAIDRITQRHEDFKASLQQHPAIRNIRYRGTILAVEFKSEEATGYFNNLRDTLYRFFLKRGLLLRPLGNIIYVLPPYCISDKQLDKVYEGIEAALDRFIKK